MLANMPDDFHETLNLALKIKQLSIPFASKFMHAKRWLKVSRVFPPKIVQQMFGVKTPSMKSLVSKQWSTSELTAGMEHLLTDMRNELPDEVAHLEAHHAADHQSRTSRLNFLGSACSLQKPCDFVGIMLLPSSGDFVIFSSWNSYNYGMPSQPCVCLLEALQATLADLEAQQKAV